MSKSKRIVKHGCYRAKNIDLKIRDRKGALMKGEHDVFVLTKASKKGFVKVKTITSIENDNTGTYQYGSMENIKRGRVVAIPLKEMNSNKLSGIHRKPIWIHKSKLFKSKNDFKYPLSFDSVINIDKR